MPNLSSVDLLVLVLYLAGVVWLGWWLGRGVQNAKDFLIGKKDMPWWAILGSIVATETSTITFLSVPGIAYAQDGDMRFLQLAIGYIIGRMIIVYWLLPSYFRGELYTVYQLLNDRFGRATHRLASSIFLVTRNLGDSLRLFLTAVVLETMLGWPLPICVVLIGLATIAFTFLGGMRSVVWNDCLQLTVYLAGGALALYLIVSRLDGGFSELMQFGHDTGRFRVFDFSFFADGKPRFNETYTFWAGLIGGAFLTLGTHGTDQMMVQRLLAARDQRDAGKALIASGFFVLIQFAFFLLLGVALAAFYQTHPPTYAIESSDRVLTSYIVHEMPVGVGIIGILLAAIFSVAMSTISSSLNSSATAVVADWMTSSPEQMTSRKAIVTSKLLTVVFGVLQMVIAIWAASLDDSVVNNALAIAGFASGLLLGLFALGMFVPQANQRAAMAGLCGGLVVMLVLRFGLASLPVQSSWHYTLAWPWLPVVGSLTTLACGWLVAKLTDARPSPTH